MKNPELKNKFDLHNTITFVISKMPKIRRYDRFYKLYKLLFSKHYFKRYSVHSSSGFFTSDPILGWKMIPNKRILHTNFQFFTEAMNRAVFERFILENKLRKAQDRKEFALYYQPQFDISTQRIIGVEALVRWMHPEKGVLLPDTFIPVAEETGIIIPLGEWILKKACEQAKAWQRAGYAPMYITVNISSGW